MRRVIRRASGTSGDLSLVLSGCLDIRGYTRRRVRGVTWMKSSRSWSADRSRQAFLTSGPLIMDRKFSNILEVS